MDKVRQSSAEVDMLGNKFLLLLCQGKISGGIKKEIIKKVIFIKANVIFLKILLEVLWCCRERYFWYFFFCLFFSVCFFLWKCLCIFPGFRLNTALNVKESQFEQIRRCEKICYEELHSFWLLLTNNLVVQLSGFADWGSSRLSGIG